MTFSLKEKYDLIHAHEEQFSYRLAMDVVKKPETSVWMIFIPILLVHHFYKIKQYKLSVRFFAENILTTRKKALDKAYKEAVAGGKILYDVRDYFPELDISEQDRVLAEKQVCVIQVMATHYLALLKKSGETFEKIFAGVYSNRSKYLQYLNIIEKAERELNEYIKNYIHTSEESIQVIKQIEASSKKLRKEELNHLSK
ncbi:MAG: NF038143 family protein [Desulfobacterales bacterium]|nr:NF038143 family protein [Desulfobacterales bacterium]